MAPAKHPYQPTYEVPPGRLLDEYIQTLDISARELARRCGRSAKLIVEIISGKAPIEPETALQLERVLGMQADVWLNMEAAYRLRLATADESIRLSTESAWVSGFPVRELRKLGFLKETKDIANNVRQLLAFFGAGSVAACRERFGELAAVSYRHSPSFKSAEEPLLVWLRLGELKADEIECDDFDRTRFLEALRTIRQLTTETFQTFFPKIVHLCAAAGVAFVIVKPLPGTALSGISRWLSPRKALIQQSMRHLANDHFWFTFFHEAAHLLLHSRKTVFLDGTGYGSAEPKEEEEANAWATNFLIPQAAFQKFIANFDSTPASVIEFASRHGVAPGIVVGQLQKREVIHFSQMNRLKERCRWAEGDV
jgi:HTH-type transcriptional regulator / antitoxin HigA